MIYNDTDKAKAFNQYFNEQAKVIGDNDSLPYVNPCEATLVPFKLSTDEITQVINNLDKNKAVGPDLLHNRLLTLNPYFLSTEPSADIVRHSTRRSRLCLQLRGSLSLSLLL